MPLLASKQSILFGLIFLVTGIVPSLFTTSASAGVHSSTELLAQNMQYNRGMGPGRRSGGGPRSPNSEPDQCPTNEMPVVALVPASVDNSSDLPVSYAGGVTTSEHPTLWFYIPYTFSDRFTAEFTLRNGAEAAYTISSDQLAASQQTPGVISISLPATVTLELGKVYEWSFEFICGSEPPVYVEGGIERILLDPSLVSQLAQLTPAEQAQLYWQHQDENGNRIWFDALNTVAVNLHRSAATKTTEADWDALLESIGLTQIPLPAATP